MFGVTSISATTVLVCNTVNNKHEEEKRGANI